MSELKDLKIIKNKYGEKFMHLCRELFPTILEEEGRLTEILESSFGGNSKTLGEDITEDIKEKFRSYILSKVETEKEEKIDIGEKTPYELLDEAGYDLHECKNEDDIQGFKKYYEPEEELCTFNGGRLDSCVVFWAVKKDADKIKREDFKQPKREDEYGTSVMSIQFSRGDNCTVSIKNRYNHTVNNPDATYGNNLDNIIPGLTQSFEKLLSERGMKLDSSNKEEFAIPNYTVANDGRYYKFNMEIDGVYYCPGNVIIDYGEVKKLEPEKEELIDYFILDKKGKKLKLYDSRKKDSFIDYADSFIDCFENIEKIEIIKNPDKEKKTRIISIQTKESEIPIKIEIDKDNNIVGYENHDLKEVGDGFLKCNKQLSQLSLPQLINARDKFLFSNRQLKRLNLPNLEEVGDWFLYDNKKLSQLSLPQLKKIGDSFLYNNKKLSQLSLPKLKKINNRFLFKNTEISKLFLPQIEEVGEQFLFWNRQLSQLSLLKLEKVGDKFLYCNKKIDTLSLPQLKEVGNGFLEHNNQLKQLSLPKLKKVGNNFLYFNTQLNQLGLPHLKMVGDDFLYFNTQLNQLFLPQLEEVGNGFLRSNDKLIKLSIPKLTTRGLFFLYEHPLKECLIKNMYKSLVITPSEIAETDKNNHITTSEVNDIGQVIKGKGVLQK